MTDETCRTGATLGNGEDLRVFLTNRGATVVLAELFPTSGYFTRDLDETSDLEMTATVGGLLDELCCNDWDTIYPWVHEILVYRDGRDAWCGPVTEVTFDYGTVTVRASDLTAWWDRRTIAISEIGIDLADIFNAVHVDAMDGDPVNGFTVSATATGIYGTRIYPLNEWKYASDAIAELSKTGVDWTCYGRTVLVGGGEVPGNPYFTMFDDFWSDPPQVKSRGNDQATQVVVRGKGVTGVAIAPLNYRQAYGTLVRVFDENDIEDQASADKAAQSRLDILKEQSYIETPSGATLKPTAPVTLPELIPGIKVRVDTRATCRPLVADFRLKKVKVDFKGQVSIDLQPLGSDPAITQPPFAKMVVIGDSISRWSEQAALAVGRGEPFNEIPTNRWQDWMVEDGVVGYSLDGARPGFTTRSARNTPAVTPQEADLVVICLGANDQVQTNRWVTPIPPPSTWVLPAEYRTNLEWLLDKYPAPVQVVMFPWQWNINLTDSTFDDAASNLARWGDYEIEAAGAAATYGAYYINLGNYYSYPVGSQEPIPPYLCDPLIHPNEATHRAVATLIERTIGVIS